MRNKSILLKSIICASTCLIGLLLLIFVVYIVDFFEGTFIIGVPCGIIIAAATQSNTLKRTVIARFIGMLSAVITQLVFTMSGIPYTIIMYIYRDNEFVREAGRLTVNEMIGYGWGRMFFWCGLLISFAVSIISIYILNNRKNSAKRRHGSR